LSISVALVAISVWLPDILPTFVAISAAIEALVATKAPEISAINA